MLGEAEPASGHRARWSQPSDIRRGRASPRMLGEAEPAPRRRVRQSQPSDVGRGRACPQTSGEAEPTFGRWARSIVAFLSVQKHQRLMVISSSSLGTLVFGPRHYASGTQEPG